MYLDQRSTAGAARVRLSGLQLRIILLCAAVTLVDGFDTQSIAFVAPHIVDVWRVSPVLFAPVFAAGLLASFIGALVLGPMGDRVGRKPALVISLAIFAAGSLGTAFSDSIASLIAMRLVTGLGLGGALPCSITLASEHAPAERRESLVSLMFCGFPLGAVLGGLSSEAMVALWGWKSVFIVGGLLPIVLGALFVPLVPESASFLASRGSSAPGNASAGRTAPSSRAVTVHLLFTEGRAVGTLLLWTTLFLSLLLTYFLISWIPLIARASGANVRAGVIAVSLLNLGAVCGSIPLGRLGDRYSPWRVIRAGFAAGAVPIFFIGLGQHSPVLLCVATFVAGMLSIGAQMCTVSYAAALYSTQLRGTGVGWAMGIGRLGAIAGPMLGGLLVNVSMNPPILFAFAAGASLAAGGSMWALGTTGSGLAEQIVDGGTR
ncbi:MFS transporter [Paraburkholderia fungorum]|uniref:AAHS family 4-hydroxybenzoate transporter-like MFS transporter n=1 Tax=Paraburkholderia fungorum TaxID=134537 RepID=A0AAW3UQ84_9BURK|nr:MFS transporter [Paraburkholderia fungorum]MBB4512592.1 AAHS family 4-hydroxybenzoate transporter-like MFS transporter [Paraburkholderia fungorum]MBB6200498.1 AAHS family 4-hydroxybenzoate transporter-like MFS transporter [Paraburkholderia fungorum]